MPKLKNGLVQYGRIPDSLFAGKMPVEPTFGQTGDFENFVDGCIVIAFDGKKLQRTFFAPTLEHGSEKNKELSMVKECIAVAMPF